MCKCMCVHVVCVYVCTHICARTYAHTRLHTCLHTYKGRLEDNLSPSVNSTLFYEAETFIGLEVTKQVRLAHWQAPGIHLSLPPQSWN